jgi:hypothetical protein
MRRLRHALMGEPRLPLAIRLGLVAFIAAAAYVCAHWKLCRPPEFLLGGLVFVGMVALWKRRWWNPRHAGAPPPSS